MIKKTPRKELPLERKHTKWICGKLKVNQGSTFPSETLPSSDRPQQSPFENSWSFSKSVRNRETCQKRRFPVLLRLLAVCPANTRRKKLDICKFTRLVANLHGCALNQSIPPFVSDGGKERRSFKFFRREIRGVRIEKSGAALAQIHTPLPARHHHYSRSTWSSYFHTLLQFTQVNFLQMNTKTSPQTKILLLLYKLKT